MDTLFNPTNQVHPATNAQTNAINVKATAWLRIDMKIGTDWIQIAFNALDGSYADKTAQKIVRSINLTPESPEKISEQRGLKFTLKSANEDTGVFDASEIL